MSDFQEIVKLRNEGKKQKDIARTLGLSERTIRNYLKNGKIPIYNRATQTKEDPFVPFEGKVIELIEKYSSVSSQEIYEQLLPLGYKGSYRTVSRKTEILRKKAKAKPVYFERIHKPGEYMEGDFTEITGISIGGEIKTINLWVSVLTYSNKIFATPFLNETFECFAQGSVDAFTEFGGTAITYRLDNMKPVVFKILKEGRIVTTKFKEMQDHYEFKVEFCNPASGWEKGDVESMNNYLKRKIREKIHLSSLSFSSLEAFKIFVWDLCRQMNQRTEIAVKSATEILRLLPQKQFESYRIYMVKVNKYSTFCLDDCGQKYSAPTDYIGLTLEARVSPYEVKLFFQSKMIATHKRLYGKDDTASIQIEHIIKALSKKPGVASSWKHKDILFKNPTWNLFYEKLVEQADGRDMIKEYLKCLELIGEHGRDEVTMAMELCLQENLFVSRKRLEEIITNEGFDPLTIKPHRRNLIEYDQFLKGEAVQ